jgi:non-ribosomal peptide synthetase component F
MVSSGMVRCVTEERSASFIRVTRIGELGTTLAVTSNRRTLRRNSSPNLVTLMKEVLSSSETSVLTIATQRNIPEDTILHSHRRENLNLTGCSISLNMTSTRPQSIRSIRDLQYRECA